MENNCHKSQAKKTAVTVRNVVFAMSLFVATLSMVTLFVNFVELLLYRPVSNSVKGWVEYQDAVTGLVAFAAVLTTLGVAFAVVSLIIKKLRLASIIVFGVIAIILLILAIVAASLSVAYITEDMKKWETPLYVGGSLDAMTVSLSSGFSAAALRPCICFAVMAVCALFLFLAERKEIAAPEVKREEPVAPAPAPASAPVAPFSSESYYDAPSTAPTEDQSAPAARYCTKCGKKIEPGANFCIGCGTKAE